MARVPLDDTICAIATPVGEGGIGVVRMSGRQSLPITREVFRDRRGRCVEAFKPQRLYYGSIVGSDGRPLDEVFVVYFKEPRSYTREDMVEVSAHGSMRVLKEILEILVRRGARLAEPGEFTKRAFLSGRLDLAQAEAVLDLIRSKTDAARAQALRHLQGDFSREIERLKHRLLKLCAHVEAYVDFPEDDIEVYSEGEFLRAFHEMETEIRRLADSFRRGAVLREGILTVIVGRPNVGKSSLLNAFLGRDRAIVSEVPGTTRDALEESWELDGMLLRLVDTAGLRSRPKVVESIGIEKTKEYMEQAQLFLMMVDGSQRLTSEDEKIGEEIRKKKHILVVNKTDLPERLDRESLMTLVGTEPSRVSVKTGLGIPELRERIRKTVSNGELDCESPLVTRVRHRQALEKACEAVQKAREGFQARLSLEFIAFDLREAVNQLSEIVGEIYTEDILDTVFREFCIGK